MMGSLFALYSVTIFMEHGILAPFGYADKPAEKHCWLICCERKTLFPLKKQAEKDGL
jgi:hypothetical protein